MCVCGGGGGLYAPGQDGPAGGWVSDYHPLPLNWFMNPEPSALIIPLSCGRGWVLFLAAKYVLYRAAEYRAAEYLLCVCVGKHTFYVLCLRMHGLVLVRNTQWTYALPSAP